MPNMTGAEVCAALSYVGSSGAVKFSTLDKGFQAETVKSVERVVEARGETQLTVELLTR